MDALWKGSQRSISSGYGRIDSKSRLPETLVGERLVIPRLAGDRSRHVDLIQKLLSPFPQPREHIIAQALEIDRERFESRVSEGRPACCRPI
jgi:hypothetical protein